MDKYPPHSAFIAYNEESQQIEIYTVDREAVKELKQAALVVPWPFEPPFDDEFARKLGGAALSLLTLGQPELTPLITVTKDPSGRKEYQPMSKRPPRCVFIAYDEKNQQIETFTVDRDAVKKRQQTKPVMRWSLKQYPRLDDEFARNLGKTALSLLARGQPGLAPHIAATKIPS